MHPELKRLLQFVKRTGDHLILLDPDSKEPYVILPFETYERIAEGGNMAENMPQHNHLASPELFPQIPIPEESSASERGESEGLPGIDTELVELPEQESESPLIEEGKYYFEAVETEAEAEKKQENTPSKTKRNSEN